MIHKRQGMPSKNWLVKYLSRYQNQRVTFQLAPGSTWWKICTEGGAFEGDKPIMVSGIFVGLHKRPKDWPDVFAHGPTTLFLRFRGLVFRQGDKVGRFPLGQTHYQKRTQEGEFELSEMWGRGLAERLASMIPRLGYNLGRIIFSEGPLEAGFPSNKELPPLPQGSDFSEE